MAEQRRGKIIARGSDAFVALVMEALDECVNATIDNLPLTDYVIESHSPVEFQAQGYIIKGTGDTAEGYVHAPGVLWINSRVATLRPKRARHIIRHEIGHVVPLTQGKRNDLMKLMKDASGNHPTNWKAGGYLSRPSECFADTFAEAVSGQDSPWDDFSFYRLDVDEADVPMLLVIALRTDPAPIPPPPPAEPLPPVDPALAELKAENARLTAENSRLDMELTSSQITIINARTFRDKAIEDLKLVAP